MLREAIEIQQNAVSEIINTLSYKNEIIFKAPTGSGKTYMMADLISRILDERDDIVFIVSTLSKGDLASQNYTKFCEYIRQGSFKNISPYLISSEVSSEERLFIPTLHNVYFLPRDLYKKNSKLMQGAMDNFLQTLKLPPLLKGLGKKIYLIKDECHIATSNLDTISNTYFEKTINFSATPNLKRGQTPDVEIKDEDAVRTKLIKHITLGDETDTVADAISKFEEIKHEYRNLLGINPCLIIQISNKEKADYELKNIIMPELNKIEHQDLKWMLIVDNPKDCDTNDIFKAKTLPISKWKSYAKENTATIDIIIFKMVISEGWDIPRACMLYQIRDSGSTQLDEQVIGRVRRNPKLLTFETLSESAQELATTAWIWGIVSEKKHNFISVNQKLKNESSKQNISLCTTKLRQPSTNQDFFLEDLINSAKPKATSSNIFSLYRHLNKADDNIKSLCYDYSDSVTKWLKFTENLDSISKAHNNFICNYESSMELTHNEKGEILYTTLPETSAYIDNGNYININDWLWQRNDGKDKFSFDSEAERDWANILKDLSSKNLPNSYIRAIKEAKQPANESLLESNNLNSIYLWGKNYQINSDIKYEYYLNGIHSSYPDFVLQDAFNRIHIFEVKSLNVSSSTLPNFDQNNYKLKIEELKKCYKQASVLTGHIFYIPILSGDVWQICQLVNGEEFNLSKEQFIDFIINNK